MGGDCRATYNPAATVLEETATVDVPEDLQEKERSERSRMEQDEFAFHQAWQEEE